MNATRDAAAEMQRKVEETIAQMRVEAAKMEEEIDAMTEKMIEMIRRRQRELMEQGPIAHRAAAVMIKAQFAAM